MTTIDETQLVERLQQEVAQLRNDSVIRNLLTGVGVLGQDKRLGRAVGEVENLGQQALDNLFEGDSYAAKIIEFLPRLETRKWCLYSQKSKNKRRKNGEQTAEMQKRLDAIAPHFTEARILARKMGGSAILLGADDGITNYERPLAENRLKDIRWFNVLEGGESGEIRVEQWQEDPRESDYGLPLIYQMNDTAGTYVHRSRLLLFYGIWPGKRRSRDHYHGWGAPVMARSYNPLSNYRQSVDAIAIALQDFNRLVVKISGLIDLVSAGQKELVIERVRLLEYMSSLLKAAIIDPGDSYEILARDFTGVKEMLDVLKSDLGAASDGLPHTVLFNQSPSGVTSGSSERADLNNAVSANQEDHRHLVDRYIYLLHRCSDGPTGGVPPESYELDFPSVYQLSEQEQAEVDYKKSQTNKNYVDIYAVYPDEVAEAIARNVPLGSVIDLEARKQEHQALRREPEGATNA